MTRHAWEAKPGAAEVSRLRHAVADYAAAEGLDGDRVQDIALAVSEVVSNAVIHGYPDGGDGTITVEAAVVGDDMVLTVVDDGVGIGSRSDSPGAGFGLRIARKVAQQLAVRRAAHGGTEIRMRFARTA